MMVDGCPGEGESGEKQQAQDYMQMQNAEAEDEKAMDLTVMVVGVGVDVDDVRDAEAPVAVDPSKAVRYSSSRSIQWMAVILRVLRARRLDVAG
jgi:hypothetical protein